jgi:hypothetical protein
MALSLDQDSLQFGLRRNCQPVNLTVITRDRTRIFTDGSG